jgi:hypothetical protein
MRVVFVSSENSVIEDDPPLPAEPQQHDHRYTVMLSEKEKDDAFSSFSQERPTVRDVVPVVKKPAVAAPKPSARQPVQPAADDERELPGKILKLAKLVFHF